MMKFPIADCRLPIAFLASLALLAFLPFSARAQTTSVLAYVTFTNTSNGATNGQTITGNGSVRTYTNTITAGPSTRIQATNNSGWAATNTWLHLIVNKFTGTEKVSLTNTNQIVIQGIINNALTVTLSANLGTVSYVTQVWDSVREVVYPPGGMASERGRTNNESGVIEILNGGRATNALNNGLQAFSNYLDRITAQTFSNKTAYAFTNRLGLSDGERLTNVVSLSGSNGTMTKLRLVDAYLSNPTNGTLIVTGATTLAATSDNPFVFDGSLGILNVGDGEVLFGPGYLTLTLAGPPGLKIINTDIHPTDPTWSADGSGNQTNAGSLNVAGGTTNWGPTVLQQGISSNLNLRGPTWSDKGGFFHINLGSNNVALDEFAVLAGLENAGGFSSAIFGNGNSDYGTEGGSVLMGLENFAGTNTLNITAVGNGNTFSNRSPGTVQGSAAFGNYNLVTNAFTTIIGNGGRSTEDNQIIFAGATNSVILEGKLVAKAGVTNLQTLAGGTNIFGGDISFPRGTVSSVANGHNTINLGTNVWVDLTGSPSAAWTWGGITGGNRNGKFLIVRNLTGYSTDILDNSGTEPTAANRIDTPTGTNTTLNASGIAEFIYDSSASRWVLLNVFNTATPAASATNAVASIATNGVYILGAGLTNIDFVSGVTGYLVGGTAKLGVSAAGSSATNVFDTTQFATVNGTNEFIKDGALLTNVSIRTALTLPSITASRAAVINSSGQVTNSAAVDTTELEYVDGVTSAIQPQLNALRAAVLPSFYTSNLTVTVGGTNFIYWLTNSITNALNLFVTNLSPGFTAEVHVNGNTAASNNLGFFTYPPGITAIWYGPTNTAFRSNRWTVVQFECVATNWLFVAAKEQP